MQVTVKQINKPINGRISVVCFTNHGDITGIWQSEEPEINQSYFVEIDFSKKLIWGLDITVTDCHEYHAWIEKDITFLIIKKEVYDEDGCLTFRFGDSLTLIETEGLPISKKELFYRIKSRNLLLYPINC